MNSFDLVGSEVTSDRKLMSRALIAKVGFTLLYWTCNEFTRSFSSIKQLYDDNRPIYSFQFNGGNGVHLQVKYVEQEDDVDVDGLNL